MLGKHRHATASQLRNDWKLRTTRLPIKFRLGYIPQVGDA